jgi:ApbE superfamily uncharacterized protein (UPF0280 family)
LISTECAGLFKQAFEQGESICTLISDREDAIEAAASSIKFHRKKLEKFVQEHPLFLYALQPIHVETGPEVIRLMTGAARRADVGPMAAVAGVLADLAVEAMVMEGAEVAVVEDGGEVSLVSDRPIDIALSAGDSPLSKRVGFRLHQFPAGVATSSGLYSHALSFGEADAVTIFAENAGLADAAATAVGNLVKGEKRVSIKRGVERGLSIEGVRGVFIIHQGLVGVGGEVPTIISVCINDLEGARRARET